MQGFLEALKTVAGHPLALVGYVAVVAAWTFAIYRHGRLRALASMLDKVPEAERASLIKRQLDVVPRADLSAKEWLQHRKRNQLLIAFIATLVVGVLIVGLALFRSGGGVKSRGETSLSLKASFIPDPGFLTRGEVRAVVQNTGLVAAEALAVELILPEGAQLVEDIWGPTEHIANLPPEISQTVRWTVVVNSGALESLEVRASGANAPLRSARASLPASQQALYERFVLGFSGTEIQVLEDGMLGVLDSGGLSVIVVSQTGEEQGRIPLPTPCSGVSATTYDDHRGLFWVTCPDSSRVGAVRITDASAVTIPSFPLVQDENGTPLSRTPYSLAVSANHIFCTTTDGEQGLWVLSWPEGKEQPADHWVAIPYPDELTWTDCVAKWDAKNQQLVLLHADVIPSSVSFYDPSLTDDPFRHLTGHDYEHVGGVSDVALHPEMPGFVCDQYGERLRLIAPDGTAQAGVPLTPETDWTGGTRKRSLISIDDAGAQIAVAVNTTGAIESPSTSVFLVDATTWSNPTRLGHWADAPALDVAMSAQGLFVLCQSGSGGSEVRKFSLKH